MPNPLDSILNFDPSKPSQGGGIPGQPHPSAGGKPLPGIKTSPSTVGGGDFLSSITGFQPKNQPIAPISTPQDTQTEFQKQGIAYRAGKGIVKTGVVAAKMLTSSADFFIDLIGNRLNHTAPIAANIIPVLPKNLGYTPAAQNKLNEWKEFYKEHSAQMPTEKAKEVMNKVEQWAPLQATKEWQELPTAKKFSKKYIAETAFEVGPSIIASLGMYAINPTLGFAASAGSTADDVKTSAIKYGVDPDAAEMLGLGTGYVVGAIDRMSAGKVLETVEKEVVKKGIIKGFGNAVLDIFKSGLEEGGTEVLQEVIQMAMERTFRDDMNWDEATQRAALSFFGGLLGGAGGKTIINSAAAISSNARKAEEVKTEEQKKTIDDIFAGMIKPKEQAQTLPPSAISQPIPTTAPEVITPEKKTISQPSASDQPIPTNTVVKEDVSPILDTLTKEAKRYKTAEEFVNVINSRHRPPDSEGGRPLNDLAEMYPDIYTNEGERYYANYGMSGEKEAFRIIQSFKDSPNKKITIFRAVNPDEEKTINSGDWVTISKDYAKQHGESNLKSGYKIVKKVVKASDIFNDGNSIVEWGYRPDGHKDLTKQELVNIWNKANTSLPPSVSSQPVPIVPKTQKEVVSAAIQTTPKSIKEIAAETKIKEANIRRILGVGTKEGDFERVAEGVYRLNINGESLAYIETGNAMEVLPRLADEGFKADMVFLDIPYDTPAIKGGNRGANYNLISVDDFAIVLDAVKKIARTDDTPIIYMYSNAKSGLKKMQKYNDMLSEKGFFATAKGEYQKTFFDGKPVTNPRGKVAAPEGILVFTKSGKVDPNIQNLNFKLVRPKGYQTEKASEMIAEMIKMTTNEGDVVLDPFAGSGVVGAEAIKTGRKAYLVEKNAEVVENIIKPRLKNAVPIKVKSLAKSAASISKEAPKGLFPAAQVTNGVIIMNNLNFGLELKTELPDGKYTVSKGEFLSTDKGEDVPPLPTLDDKKEMFQIDTDRLVDMFSKASEFISENSVREELQSVNMVITGNKASILATDSYTLQYDSMALDSMQDGTINFMSPDLLAKNLSLLGDNVKVSTNKDNSQIEIVGDNGRIFVRGTSLNFPNISVIMKQVDKQYTFSSKALSDAIKSLKAIYSTNPNNIINITYNEDNTVTLTAIDKDGGNKREIVIPMTPANIKYNPTLDDTEPFSFVMPIIGDERGSFNAEFLLKSIKANEGETISFQYGSSPALRISAEVQPETMTPSKKTKGSSLGSLSGGATATLDSFEQRMAIGDAPGGFKIYEQVLNLIHKYAKRVQQGNVPSGSLGVFYRQSKTIGLKSLNDVGVAAHEISHFLDDSYKIISRVTEEPQGSKNKKLLTQMYIDNYPGAKRYHKLSTRLKEGFAMLVQKYVESPQETTAKYPELVADFLSPGGTYYEPVVDEMIGDIAKFVTNYQALSPLDKVKARIVSGDLSVKDKKILNLGEKIREFWADSLYAWEKVEKVNGIQWTDESAALAMRQYSNAGAIASNNIVGKSKIRKIGGKTITLREGGYWAMRDGTITKVLDYNFGDLIGELEYYGFLDDFNGYLVARNQVELYKELDSLKEEYKAAKEALSFDEDEDTSDAANEVDMLKESIAEKEEILRKDKFDRSIMEAAYEENKARFLKFETMFDGLMKAQLDNLSDKEVNLLSEEGKARLLNRKGYASQKRKFYDEIIGDKPVFASLNVGKTKVSSLFGRRGADLPIIAPLYSALQSEFEIQKKSLKQIIYNKIAESVVSGRLPADLFQQLELKVVPDGNGGFKYPQENDTNIIIGRVGKDGKRIPIIMDSQLKSVLDNLLTVQSYGVFEKALITAARIKTKGTTGFEPTFGMANAIMDSISTAAQTRNKVIPVVDAARILSRALFTEGSDEGRFFQEYVIGAGTSQTFRGVGKESPEETFNRVVTDDQKIMKMIENGVSILALPSQASEIANRATEFIKARMSGKSYRVAMEEAARVTGSFSHSGSYGNSQFLKVWMKSRAYSNAAIQVLDNAIQNIEDPKQRSRYLIVTSAIAASMVATYAAMLFKLLDDDAKEQLLNLSSKEQSSYLFIPVGDGKIKKIKIPDNMGFIAAMINMSMANMVQSGNYDFHDYLSGLSAWVPTQFNIAEGRQMLFSALPDLIAPSTKVAFGVKSYPVVTALESEKQKRLPTEMRQTKSTSMVAKAISKLWVNTLGDKLAPSPIQIDYWVRETFGTVSKYVMIKPGAYNPLQRFEVDLQFEYSKKVNEFYEGRKKNDQYFNAYKEGKEYPDEQLNKILNDREIYQYTTKLLKEYYEIDPKEDPEGAKNLIREINENILSLRDSE